MKLSVIMPVYNERRTIHEIVAHATELDRIMGYEANYAGTSFVKTSDVGKLKYGSKLMNVTADKTDNGLGSTGYDDDGVKTTKFDIIKDGMLVGVSTNREVAHYIGEKQSRGCTQASSWAQYPFLRMPNVHLEADPKGPTPAEMIAMRFQPPEPRVGKIDARGRSPIDTVGRAESLDGTSNTVSRRFVPPRPGLACWRKNSVGSVKEGV